MVGDDISLIRGIKHVSLVNKRTSTTLVVTQVTIPHDPLQIPSSECRLRKIMTGQPIFSFKRASGNPEGVVPCSVSMGQ